MKTKNIYLLPKELIERFQNYSFDNVICPTPGPQGLLERSLMSNFETLYTSRCTRYFPLDSDNITWEQYLNKTYSKKKIKNIGNPYYFGTCTVGELYGVMNFCEGKNLLIIDPCNWNSIPLRHSPTKDSFNGVIVLTGSETRKKRGLDHKAKLLFGGTSFECIYSAVIPSRINLESKNTRRISVYSSLKDF